MKMVRQKKNKGEKTQEEEEIRESESLAPVISLKALAGVPTVANYNTIKVSGSVNGSKVHILVDSGSTHNFLDSYIVEKLECETIKCSPVKVVVADSYTTQCDKMCLGMKWKMQGVEFQADVLILPIEGSQMVLGTQWLAMLGPILWDFSNLRMEFTVGNKKVVLRGSPQPKLQLMSGKSLLNVL